MQDVGVCMEMKWMYLRYLVNCKKVNPVAKLIT